MRIVHAIASLAPQHGGPSRAVVAMARSVAALGHDVTIHSTDLDLPAGKREQHGGAGSGYRCVIHRHLPLPQLTRQIALQASPSMWRALAAEIPTADVVHLHSLYLFHDWVVWRHCTRAGVPYILRPHGTLDPYIHRRHRRRKAVVEALFQNRCTRDAALIHYTSAAERHLARPFVFKRPGAVVPLGLDADEFSALPDPALFRTRYPETGNRRLVLFLGRLNFKKGIDLLVSAFAAASRQRDDLHLVLAGPDGGFEAGARRMVAASGLAERTTFTGHLDRQDVVKAYAAADVFVLPSHSENFGIAAAEALAAGVPSILSDQVHIAPDAASAGACRLVSVDVPALTEALADLLAAPEKARLMADRARAYIRDTFAWPAVAKKLVAMYETAIHSRS